MKIKCWHFEIKKSLVLKSEGLLVYSWSYQGSCWGATELFLPAHPLKHSTVDESRRNKTRQQP